MSQKNKAFTLVELLVVMGLISVLIAMLMPALSAARQQAKTVQCLSNLRQLAVAAENYVALNDGYYPLAYWRYSAKREDDWDFSTLDNWKTVRPGLLWMGHTSMRIQQCPSFEGKSNTLNDPYTGYNYNTSYIGGDQGAHPPAKASQVREPSRTALFGDGQWSLGADKYMRAPLLGPDGPSANRYAGTQGFRHHGKTNVAFCDGHAETLGVRFTNTVPGQESKIAPRTGFLSPDNSLYDLK
jgi:prepilin-type N-terminal cleavage/methylation domain-containing protein/prepilin-type processing-associated H-X9-DG protein